MSDGTIHIKDRDLTYEDVKKLVYTELIPHEGNEGKLAIAPHESFMDLEAVFRLDLKDIVRPGATALVTNGMLQQLGVSDWTFQNECREAARLNRPGVLQPLAAVLFGMSADMDSPAGMEAPPIFVASTEGMVQGASAVTYAYFLRDAAERIGGDFFLLPSSIHEMLLVPDTGTMSVQELETMVRTINDMEVAPEEHLSNHVYHYDARERTVEMGLSWEANKTKKQTHEKSSVMEKLGQQKDRDAMKQPKAPKKAKNREEAL